MLGGLFGKKERKDNLFRRICLTCSHFYVTNKDLIRIINYYHFFILILKTMRRVRSSIFFFISIFCMFLYYSCSTCSSPQTVKNITVDIDLAELAKLADNSIYLEMGNKVLYSMPTPIEASMLVKNWGIPNPALLNNPANASSYLTKKKQALNLGVYLSDLLSAGLYEQTQTVLHYKQALSELVEGLGLQSVVDKNVMKKIESNVNNKNELLQIVSDVYASCSEYFCEDDRDFYALAIMSGGWVEGMYLATSMIDETQVSNEEQMKQIVNENKLTFDLLWQALGEIDNIPEDAVYLMLDMSYLARLLGHKTLDSISPKVDINNIDVQFFAELKSHIQLLRDQFTKI